MTQRKHKKSAPHGHGSANESKSVAGGLHKDWRVWVAVAMMLAAMIVYVITLDDSIVPAIMTR